MVCCRCDHQMPRIEIIANNHCDEQEVDVIVPTGNIIILLILFYKLLFSRLLWHQ